MSDYPMLISNKLHSFRNFFMQKYIKKAEPWKLIHPIPGLSFTATRVAVLLHTSCSVTARGLQ